MSTFITPVPLPSTWTLLFKFAKVTVALPIEPTTPFPTIRTALLTALNSTPGRTEINNIPLPNSPEEVQLGIPIKAGDVTSGWRNVESEDDGGKKSKNGLKDCPKGVGLRDGAVVAFKFGDELAEDEWVVKIPSFDEESEDEQVGEEGNLPHEMEDLAGSTKREHSVSETRARAMESRIAPISATEMT